MGDLSLVWSRVEALSDWYRRLSLVDADSLRVEILGNRVRVVELENERDRLRAALQLCVEAFDEAMGDTDLPEDDSKMMGAMQCAVAVLQPSRLDGDGSGDAGAVEYEGDAVPRA